MLSKLSQDRQGDPVLTQPKSFDLSRKMGMRTSLLRKHASLEGELHSQDENVAEADRVNRVGESEIPISICPPTVAKRGGDLLEVACVLSPVPQLVIGSTSRQIWESMMPLHARGLVSSLVIQVKVSEGDLSQWINCHLSNGGTDCGSRIKDRWIGRQCHSQGSESIVVGGVTSIQGEGSAVHRAKGLRSDSSITHRCRGKYSLINAPETMEHLLSRLLGWNAVCDESRSHSVGGALLRPLNGN
jgi:hypothetical protein